jgi:hypothetical protein
MIILQHRVDKALKSLLNDYCIVTGNPVKELKKQRTKLLNYNPREFLAANNAWLK